MIPAGENAIYRLTARYAANIAVILIACHYFGATPAVLIVVAGCAAALANKVSVALSAFILLPFIMVFNPILIPKSGMLWGLTLRGGPLLIGLCLAMTSQRRKGNFKLPFNMLWGYLFIAAICSAQGYVPKISYAKLVNFGLFLWVICETTKNLRSEQGELLRLRAFLLGLSALLVLGSLVSYRYPAISTMDGLDMMKNNLGVDVDMVDDYVQSLGGVKLFVGLLNQSQTFAGVVSCCFGWTICDMLFVERRFRWQHGTLICLMPILIFMTRSRMGLLIILAFGAMLYGFTMSHVAMAPMLKSRINNILTFIVVVGISALVIGESRNKTVSRWLRKTDSVATDERGLTEAVTSSRQGLIARNMRDFRRNKLLGSGFQVAANHVDQYKGRPGIIITAPIEKGILPLMVLGETGILGSVFFLLFLSNFFTQCVQMRLWSTLTLFTALFMSNMAEATFFSPGGAGGIEWCFTVVGGFICDSYIQSVQDMRPFPPPLRQGRA